MFHSMNSSPAGRRRTAGLFVAITLTASACTAAHAARHLPEPRPAQVRASGTVSVFPPPGTVAVSPATTVSFRGVKATDLGTVVVVGSTSGPHEGRIVAHSDDRGVSFVPSKPFAPGESLTVRSRLAVRGAKNGAFAWTVARPSKGVDALLPAPQTPPSSRDVARFRSRPDLRPPRVAVKRGATVTAGGDVFLTPNPIL